MQRARVGTEKIETERTTTLGRLGSERRRWGGEEQREREREQREEGAERERESERREKREKRQKYIFGEEEHEGMRI